MNLSIEQMEFLASKGLSIQDVIEFANITPSRSKAAERQARYRERVKEAECQTDDVTCDVTRDGNESDAAPLSPSPKEINSNPHPHTPVNKTPARKGHRLPDDWEPKPLTADLAEAVKAWPSGAIERELAKFRDWAASANGPNALKKDWDAAWRNWLRKAEEDGRYARKSTVDRDDKRDGAMRALDRQLGLDEPSRQAGRGNAGESGSYLSLAAPRSAALR